LTTPHSYEITSSSSVTPPDPEWSPMKMPAEVPANLDATIAGLGYIVFEPNVVGFFKDDAEAKSRRRLTALRYAVTVLAAVTLAIAAVFGLRDSHVTLLGVIAMAACGIFIAMSITLWSQPLMPSWKVSNYDEYVKGLFRRRLPGPSYHAAEALTMKLGADLVEVEHLGSFGLLFVPGSDGRRYVSGWDGYQVLLIGRTQ
jgi:hypothetical protein